MKTSARRVALAGMIAGLYAGLTLLFGALSFLPQQIRFAESLTVLPFLFPAAVPGLTVGCLVANIVGGSGLPDIIFGTLATLLAALATARTRKMAFAPLWPVLFNAVIVGVMLTFVFGPVRAEMFALNIAQVGFGQLVACYGLGLPLLWALAKIFKRERAG